MVRNEKGVTLVELLIVIVILGIIAAISVPAVGNIVSNAEKDALLGDATNLESAIDLYCTSEDDPDDEDPCEG
ncbi:MAG: type II secretion system protein, partial [Candidatus Izemoplasmataceae bacterium]